MIVLGPCIKVIDCITIVIYYCMYSYNYNFDLCFYVIDVYCMFLVVAPATAISNGLSRGHRVQMTK